MVEMAPIEDLMEAFNLTREEVKALMEAHDNYVEQLANIDLQIGVMITITTAVALASHAKMDPVVFVRMVQDVLFACTEDKGTEIINEA
mgnify:FL=1|tara:strand:- start:1233 stop:1499 length:267 start_codon:yes stop_codon:yes gene_type:complete